MITESVIIRRFPRYSDVGGKPSIYKYDIKFMEGERSVGGFYAESLASAAEEIKGYLMWPADPDTTSKEKSGNKDKAMKIMLTLVRRLREAHKLHREYKAASDFHDMREMHETIETAYGAEVEALHNALQEAKAIYADMEIE